MDENFSLLAQSRANYYTKGSPVQFVQVEMLRGDKSGDMAVCLSFKNIGEAVLTGLVIEFRCKNTQGDVVCDSQYYYENIEAHKGDIFGSDDAVFISSRPIGSVEIVLDRAFQSGAVIPLSAYKRVRLPAARVLPANLAEALQKRCGNNKLKYAPQMVDGGWYCACGAFHPAEENCAECSECGEDRVTLQNALSSLLQPAKQDDDIKVAAKPVKQAAAAEDDGRTRISRRSETEAKLRELRRMAEEDREEQDDDDVKRVPDRPMKKAPVAEEEDEKDTSDADELAAAIIRWAPPITLLLCAIIAMGGYVWYQIFIR